MTCPRTAAAAAATVLAGALAAPAGARHSQPDEPCWWGVQVTPDTSERLYQVRMPRWFEGCQGPRLMIGRSDSQADAEPSYSSETSNPSAKRAKKRKKARRRHRNRKRGSARARR